jgi:hypothetical protein
VTPPVTPPVTVPTTLEIQVLMAADDLAGGAEASSVSMAMMQAGFDQLTADGLVYFPGAEPKQGIAFEEGDASLIAAGLGDGPRLSVDDLVGGWAAMAPSQTVDALRAALVADLRAGAASTSETRRFWAQLVVQLGRTSPQAYDLLDPAVPGTSLLDPVQVAFLSYRYQAELFAAGRKAAGLPVQPRIAAAAAATPRPCTMTDTAATVMDGAALGTSTFMGSLIEEAGKTVAAAEKLGKFTGRANAALTFVKIIWTLLAFEAKVSADTGLLVRNWDGVAGDPAQLKATFRFNTGNAQIANCLRPALNAMGIDFSLPQDGPIANAGVDWEMFDVWERDAKKSILRYLEGHPPLNHRTNDAGEDTTDVEGAPKSPALTGKITPDYRMVPFVAKVALKDTKMGQDIMDAVGAAMAGNPGMIAVSALWETLSRAKTLVFAGRYNLPVEDHQSLANVLITAQLTGAVSGTVTADGKGSESADASVFLVEKPAPDAKKLDFVFVNNNPAIAAFQLKENGLRTFRYRGGYALTGPCTCVGGDLTSRGAADLGRTTTADGDDSFVFATVQPSGAFSMDIPLGALFAKGSSHQSASGCNEPDASDDQTLATPYHFGKITVTGQLDLTRSSGTIEGTWSGTQVTELPYRLGGFYKDGAPQTTLSLSGPVQYVFEYTVTRMTVPGGSLPSSAGGLALATGLASAQARLVAAPPATVVPAFTSWLAERQQAQQLACLVAR